MKLRQIKLDRLHFTFYIVHFTKNNFAENLNFTTFDTLNNKK